MPFYQRQELRDRDVRNEQKSCVVVFIEKHTELDPECRPGSHLRTDAEPSTTKLNDLSNKSQTESCTLAALLSALFRLVESSYVVLNQLGPKLNIITLVNPQKSFPFAKSLDLIPKPVSETSIRTTIVSKVDRFW